MGNDDWSEPDQAYTRHRRSRRNNDEVNLTTRLPPHSLESEQGALGCVLLDPPKVVELATLPKDYFYDLRHQTIAEHMVKMMKIGRPIDLIALQEWLGARNVLEAVGGISYLSQLADACPSGAMLPTYLDILREKWTLRNVLKVCANAMQRVYEQQGEVAQIVGEFQRDAIAITPVEGQRQTPIKELVRQSIDIIERQHTSGGAVTGIATGFPDLDRLTTGLQPSDMWVIAARPKQGKTSLAVQIAEHAAVESRLPVGIFTLEMTDLQLTTRMLLGRARVNMRNVSAGFLTERDFPKITSAAGKISGAPIYIDGTTGMTPSKFRSLCRQMVMEHGIKLAVLDYIQLMRGDDPRAKLREQLVECSNTVKAVAKELGIAIIVLSQMNRSFEREKGRAPRLSDLLETGALEQDADLIAFLYRQAKKGQDDETPDPSEEASLTNLLVAAQRNGPSGETVMLTFLKGFTRFESCAKINDEPPI